MGSFCCWGEGCFAFPLPALLRPKKRLMSIFVLVLLLQAFGAYTSTKHGERAQGKRSGSFKSEHLRSHA